VGEDDAVHGLTQKRKRKKRAQRDAAPEHGEEEEDDPKSQAVQKQRRELRGELRSTLDVLRREKADMIRGDSSARAKTEALKEKQDSLFEKVRLRGGGARRRLTSFFPPRSITRGSLCWRPKRDC
jgi:hypothetical protein